MGEEGEGRGRSKRWIVRRKIYIGMRDDIKRQRQKPGGQKVKTKGRWAK